MFQGRVRQKTVGGPGEPEQLRMPGQECERALGIPRCVHAYVSKIHSGGGGGGGRGSTYLCTYVHYPLGAYVGTHFPKQSERGRKYMCMFSNSGSSHSCTYRYSNTYGPTVHRIPLVGAPFAPSVRYTRTYIHTCRHTENMRT